MKAKSRITDNKIVLSSTDVKEFLTCVLCKGLLMEPFTVKECVHSFCKSCIFKYVSVNPKCPKCGTRLSSNPYDMLSPDSKKKKKRKNDFVFFHPFFFLVLQERCKLF